MPSWILDALLASIPMVAIASFTWRLVWPRWKLFAKLVTHPILYAVLSLGIGHWSVLIAWIHQGVLGLGVHIWFCKRHGFKWYAVEDPDCYMQIGKDAVAALTRRTKA